MFRKLLVVVEIVAQNSHLSTTFKGVIGGSFICFNVNRVFFSFSRRTFFPVYMDKVSQKSPLLGGISAQVRCMETYSLFLD